MSNILMVSSEVAPFAKTGGLGDVLGTLPQEIVKLGHDVRVVMPKYGCIPEKYKQEMKFLFWTYVPLGWRNKYCGVFSLNKKGITYYFIDNEEYFDGTQLYKWNDLERFSFFDKAVLEILKSLNFCPQIIHCHDWQSGMIPVILEAYYKKDEFFWGTKTVFTIHNLKYQGIYSIEDVKDFLSLDSSYFTDDKLEFHGSANFLKAGAVYSNAITTVSPTYAEEIKTPLGGEGLDGLLRARGNSLFGIINGIDYEKYNPETDPNIFFKYDKNNAETGKSENKTALQRELGLLVDGAKPMIGIVARLTEQKGIDMICDAIPALINMGLQIVVLGTGEEKYEKTFKHYAWHNKENVSANITFDNTLAHKIYAASDFFLMPSLFEPCGLSQLIALAYGSIPIVRETGGLKDTIFSYNEFTQEGNGFSFSPPFAHDLIYTVNRAVNFFNNKTIWQQLVKDCMEERFSWEASAQKYDEIYKKI